MLDDANKIIRAGLYAARPENYFAKYVSSKKIVCSGKSYRISDYHKIWIVAIGKAADSMCHSLQKIIHANGGLIILPRGSKSKFSSKKFSIIHSSHPIPSAKSVFAAKKILSFLEQTGKNDLVVFLISGGASSLASLPDGITLEQKIKTTDILIKSGATISEINAIRKHLSGIKGGKILASLHCNAVSFVLSDVVGNDMSAIASGMTFCDKTSFLDCLQIISKYKLTTKLPSKVLSRLSDGARGKIDETPKKPKIPNQIIASNSDCLDAMLLKAKSLGYSTSKYPELFGDVITAAQKILYRFNKVKKSCLVFGGEVTVRVIGKGKGGRNQELVLRIIPKLPPNTIVASIGTDGIDGNTKYAGAIFDHRVDYETIKKYLTENDSNSFFKKYGGLIKTGPTHTNLQDIGLILQQL
ncbi:MAG: glycerate kinase [Candidatus Nitrosotenuis sp.]